MAVCTLADVVGHYAFAVIVCWRLCELARTRDVAATNVEPVATHPPIRYVGHRRAPCATSALFVSARNFLFSHWGQGIHRITPTVTIPPRSFDSTKSRRAAVNFVRVLGVGI